MPWSWVSPTNAVFLNAVAIALERRLGLVAEQDADFAAGADVVVANDVVRVAMANGDAEALVALDDVLFRQAPADAPAQEKTQVVVDHAISANDGALGAGARVEPEPGVVVAVAVFRQHVVANLPAQAVAVVVARGQGCAGSCGCSPATRRSRHNCHPGWCCWLCCRPARGFQS